MTHEARVRELESRANVTGRRMPGAKIATDPERRARLQTLLDRNGEKPPSEWNAADKAELNTLITAADKEQSHE